MLGRPESERSAGRGEIPDARTRDVLRSSTVLAVRRWPLTLASFAVIAVQAAAVTVAPAIAIGLTAAPCLYIVWAGGRYAPPRGDG
ncbi:hypothetical protein [Microbacterium sp. GXF0217]